MTATRNSHPHTMTEVAELIRNDGRIWPYWSSITCLAICWAESGGDAFARPVVLNPGNPAHLSLDVGLMQMNTYWHPSHKLSDLFDPAYNIAVAIDLALPDIQPAWRPDWTPWHAHTSGAYLKWVGAARAAINTVKANHGEATL